MAFFECEFPTAIGFLATGGPTFFTTVNDGFSGGEQRNRNWSMTRGVWTIDLQFKTQSFFNAVQSFFLVVGGQADAFRFKDHKDFTAAGQIIGYGDGATTVFQLVKNYISGPRTYVRVISKPITADVTDFQGNALPNTVALYDNEAPLVLNTDYTLDYTTGIITFVTAPTAGHIITADFEFHYPVRFTSDELKGQVEESNVSGGNPLISWANFELKEVKVNQ